VDPRAKPTVEHGCRSCPTGGFGEEPARRRSRARTVLASVVGVVAVLAIPACAGSETSTGPSAPVSIPPPTPPTTSTSLPATSTTTLAPATTTVAPVRRGAGDYPALRSNGFGEQCESNDLGDPSTWADGWYFGRLVRSTGSSIIIDPACIRITPASEAGFYGKPVGAITNNSRVEFEVPVPSGVSRLTYWCPAANEVAADVMDPKRLELGLGGDQCTWDDTFATPTAGTPLWLKVESGAVVATALQEWLIEPDAPSGPSDEFCNALPPADGFEFPYTAWSFFCAGGGVGTGP
jgi:hypothetical protein